MANVGSLVLDLALQSAQFLAGIRQATAATNNFARITSNAVSVAKGAFAGLGAALSIDVISARIKDAFDYGDAIVDLSDRTGVATSTIQEFRYAAQMSGSSVESADSALEKFAKNLGGAINGGKAMAQTLNALGVSAQDPDRALRQLMDGIAKLPTIAQRQAAATAVMGKSAGDLTALLGQGTNGFNDLAAAAQSYGIVIDDHVLRNGGQVNDQLDTMKMILNAQMANAIIQNADALMTLANAFITAASAAASFFAQMDVKKLMSVANGVGINSDIPTVIAGRLKGKSNFDIESDAKKQLMTTKDGRAALFKDRADKYNAEVRAGRKDTAYAQALKAEYDDIVKAHVAARKASTIKPAAIVSSDKTFHAPASGGAHKKSAGSSKTLKSDEELLASWERDLLNARSALAGAMSALAIDPATKANLDVSRARSGLAIRAGDIDQDTGTDAQIREGKKRYTKAQADQLKQIERAIFDAEEWRILRDRDEEIARASLAIKDAGLRNDMDLLQAEQALARTAKDRRRIALARVDKQFEQERLQLEAIIASKEATAAEKKIAEERMKILARLKGAAADDAKRQNQGPLESYLDQIPKTSEEINEAMESVQVDGLERLQSGLVDIIKGTKSVGEAFKDVAGTILDGILKIVLQQALIKPLAGLLVGSGDSASGGGGILGTILSTVIKSTVRGARANGGYTGSGTYLVGERGPELATFGSNANITPTSALRRIANDNEGRGGMSFNFGSIVSNDPAAIKRAAMEGIAQAMPMIAAQASDRTIDRLKRRQM